MSVLVVTRSDDHNGVGRVMDALAALGELAIRLDTDRYPEFVRTATQLTAAGPSRTLSTPAGRFDLNDVTALWYRRFFAGGRLPDALGDLRPASVDESRRALYGLIGALPVFQLDPLHSVRRCDHKELQLIRGQELGLDVPKTLFSNDPEAVRAFFELCGGRIVTKMQSSFAVYRQGVENVVFTNVVERAHLDDLDGLRFCPMMFQELIDKKIELRATVVGKRVYTAAVDSQQKSETRIDWRKDGVGLLKSWVPYTLPAAVEASLLALCAEIGLNYAAADFIVTDDGRHVFLEVNAGGEWFWLDEVPGLGIAQAIAGVLSDPSLRADVRG